ncbi:CheY-like chemotaxis protein [Sinobacterium caligoides]|uniref:CheY-like chemotaxis protein n=1 Tax=Sinobacterium caligoides TaxID=933926 RepID=A0A3N2DXX4_9GAMM|nr:response regulator [Sinobacterium caligoides]ROS04637.1 CheY-like chemotaxis protein [Sinobacterium caligoides]
MDSNILIVEDNADNRQLLAWLVEDAGYPHTEVGTAEQCFLMLEEQAVSLILMDISLPGMDGLTATKKLKRELLTSHIPVVACTGLEVKGRESALLEAGFDALLTKPVSYQLLHTVLEKFTPTVH